MRRRGVQGVEVVLHVEEEQRSKEAEVTRRWRRHKRVAQDMVRHQASATRRREALAFDSSSASAADLACISLVFCLVATGLPTECFSDTARWLRPAGL